MDEFTQWNFTAVKKYRIYLKNGQTIIGFYIGKQVNLFRTKGATMFTFYKEPHAFYSVDDPSIAPEQTIILMNFTIDDRSAQYNVKLVKPYCNFMQGGQLTEIELLKKPTIVTDEDALFRNGENLASTRALYSEDQALKQSQLQEATTYLHRINEVRMRQSVVSAPLERWTAANIIAIYNSGEIPPGVPEGDWTPQFMAEYPDGRIPDGLNVPPLASFIAKQQDEDEQTEQRKRPHASSGNRFNDLPPHLQERIRRYLPTRKHGPVRQNICDAPPCVVSGGTRRTRKRRRTRKNRR
jgi:hypothetical protein